MEYNISLSRVSVAILIAFFIRVLLIVFNLDFIGAIGLGIDFSLLTIAIYALVLTSFLVSFFYFMDCRSINNLKALLVSFTSLMILATIVFGVIYLYANTMEGF